MAWRDLCLAERPSLNTHPTRAVLSHCKGPAAANSAQPTIAEVDHQSIEVADHTYSGCDQHLGRCHTRISFILRHAFSNPTQQHGIDGKAVAWLTPVDLFFGDAEHAERVGQRLGAGGISACYCISETTSPSSSLMQTSSRCAASTKTRLSTGPKNARRCAASSTCRTSSSDRGS